MSDKKKRNLIIVLCVLAVVVAIAAIVLAPFGKKATGDSDSPNITESTESVVESSSAKETVNSETSETSSATADTSIVIPSSTDPTVNPNKNYTFFIDKNTFEATENEDGVTTLTAKENSNVKMTVTPVRDKSYRECCNEAESEHKKLGNSAKLEIENANTVYRSRTGDGDNDIITTVYCVDDNKGGCIIIECKTPVGSSKYMETIEIMLSMFKVI